MICSKDIALVVGHGGIPYRMATAGDNPKSIPGHVPVLAVENQE